MAAPTSPEESANTEVLQDSQKRDAEGMQNSKRKKLENHNQNVRKGSFSSRINLSYKAQNLSCVQTRVLSRYFSTSSHENRNEMRI